MRNQDSQANTSAPPKASRKELFWDDDVFDAYLSRLAKYRLDQEETDTTSKETKYGNTEDETPKEDEGDTTAEELDSMLLEAPISEGGGETTTAEWGTTTAEWGTTAVEGETTAEVETTAAEGVTSAGDTTADDEEENDDESKIGYEYEDIVIEETLRIEEDNETRNEPAIPAKWSPSLKKIKGKLVCIVGPDHLDGLAQEPWPKDVKLYQPYEVEQILLPDNANCLAVQAFLRMCNLDFEVVSRANAEFMSPSGKVPFIKCGAFIVSELEGIVQFVNNKGISLTTNMESEQKSDMRAYMSLVHNVLENAELYLCWCDKETYNEVTKPRNGSVYPWPLNYFQTWSKKSSVIKRLKMMGWYNKSLEDVYQEVENCCQALTDRLEGKEYFFGKRYSEIDALVYGHVFSILTVPLPADDNKLAFLVHRYDKLIAHSRRIHKQVMNQDCNFVVATYSGRTVSIYGNETDNVQSEVSDTEYMKGLETTKSRESVLEDAEIESIASSSDVNTNDLLYTDL